MNITYGTISQSSFELEVENVTVFGVVLDIVVMCDHYSINECGDVEFDSSDCTVLTGDKHKMDHDGLWFDETLFVVDSFIKDVVGNNEVNR